MAKLLVIDDEPNVLYSLRTSLASSSLEVLTAGTGREGVELAQSALPDAVVVDVRLPDISGLEVFEQLRLNDPRLPVVFITAFTTTETAIEAMSRGAFEYLLKPLDFHRLKEVVHKAVEVSRLSHVPAVFDDSEDSNSPGDRIVGATPPMQEVYKAIGRVAPQDVTVLIQGESGTGKELIARAIYHYSRRRHMPFLAINCAAIPESLLESELFGHERGAFTGAERRRIGKFEQVNGGTIFLDEIGDMTAPTQAKVLRVLQERSFERIGSNETITTDVRVIAASNKPLGELAAKGLFRQDLFYRLNVLTIDLPPLRHRRADLPLLAHHFVKLFSRELGKSRPVFTPAAREILDTYHWPGNVRELQSVIKFAMVHSTGEVITPDYLPDYLRGPDETPAEVIDATSRRPLEDVARLAQQLLQEGSNEIYRRVHSEVDAVLFYELLRHVRGNQLEAAELLGISRTTLRAKLRALGLAVEKQLLTDFGQGEQFLP